MLFCVFFQPLTLQNDIIQIESDSSVEFGARRADDATVGHDQVPETSHAATQCPCEAVEMGPVATNDRLQRRRACVSAISISNRKSSVSSSAADLLAKLMCLRRKMKQADDAITTV